jgi:hypothetical protein
VDHDSSWSFNNFARGVEAKDLPNRSQIPNQLVQSAANSHMYCESVGLLGLTIANKLDIQVGFAYRGPLLSTFQATVSYLVQIDCFVVIVISFMCLRDFDSFAAATEDPGLL